MKRDINELRRFVLSRSPQDYVAQLLAEKPDSFRLPGKLRAFLLVFAAIWLGGTGWGEYSNARSVFRECRFLLTARPVEAAVRQARPAEGNQVAVTLVYRVGGREHTTVQHLPSSDPRLAPRGTGGPPIGNVTLYCDEKDPAEPRLSTEARRLPELGFVVFLGPFVAIGLILLYLAVTGHVGLWLARALGFLAIYAPLSAISAFVLFIACMFLPGWWGLAAGLGMLGGYPVISLFVSGWMVHRLYRKFKAKAAVELAALEAAAPPAEGVSAGVREPWLRQTPPQAAAPAPAADATSRAAIGVEADRLSQGSIWVQGAGKGKFGLPVLVVFTVFWCGITGAFVASAAFAFWRNAVVQWRYRTTEGTVLSSDLDVHRGSEGDSYEANIRYAYAVDGGTYTGSRYAYGAAFSSDGFRRRAVNQNPAGGKVTVYYDPQNPSESVLYPRVHPTMYFLALFLQPFVVIGAGLIVATLAYPVSRRRLRRFLYEPLRMPCRIPTWGELRPDPHGAAIRRGGRALYFLGGLVGGYMISTFILTFAVALLFGGFENPDLAVVRAAFLVALGVGLAAGVIASRRAGRKAAVVLDQLLGRLCVVSPTRREEVSLKEVRFWLLRMIDNPREVHSEGDTPQAPLLSVLSADGREIPVHVFKADKEAPLIAYRAGQCLSELSAKPLRAVEPGKTSSVAPKDFLDAIGSLGRKKEAKPAGSTASGDLSDLT